MSPGAQSTTTPPLPLQDTCFAFFKSFTQQASHGLLLGAQYRAGAAGTHRTCLLISGGGGMTSLCARASNLESRGRLPGGDET